MKSYNRYPKIYVLVCLLILSGCADLRRYRGFEPLESSMWDSSITESGDRRTLITANCEVDKHIYEVRITPQSDELVAFGPILPLIPNPFSIFPSKNNLVEFQLLIRPKPPTEQLKSVFIKANNHVFKSHKIINKNEQTWYPIDYELILPTPTNSNYKLLFYFPDDLPENLSICFPNMGLRSKPSTLELQLSKSIKYDIGPPKGCFQ